MRIYIDFDDVICETARYFTKIADDLFGIKVPYEQVKFFNLQQSFGLQDEQYDALMKEGHRPEILLAYEEAPGASETIRSWLERGHQVTVITGRPFESYEASRQWLDEHQLANIELVCVDKYGRENFNKENSYSITLQEFYKMQFDFVVEDSPSAFKHLKHLTGATVAVYDRPWNREVEFPGDNYIRCVGWKEIDALLAKVSENYQPPKA